MGFPECRPRRLRRNETLRRMVRETNLSVDDLIYPLFAAAGKGIRSEVPSMPGVFQLSVENLVKEAREVAALGIPRRPPLRHPRPRRTRSGEGRVRRPTASCSPRCARSSDAVPDLVVITDVCLCEYTSHGHCGVLKGARSTTTPRSTLLAASAASPTPAPAPTSWRRPT